MPDRPHLTVPLVSLGEPLRVQAARARAAGADMVELRVDLLGSVAAALDFLAGPRELPVIATVRRAAEGGAWLGTESERLALLARLAALRPEYVDVELAAWDDFLAAWPQWQPPRAAAPRLIASYHDLHGTPANPTEWLDRLAATSADVLKVVFAALDATDAMRVAALLAGRPGRPVIALAMGAGGALTRILAPKLGGWLSFASLRAGAESAPGQLTLDELRRVYRWDALTPATRVYGVVGWPVQHSLSPLVHNSAMAAAGRDGVYVPLPVQPEHAAFVAFMERIERTPRLDITGLSVTLPHKEHALQWLAATGGACSEVARACGAVNTLTRDAAGRWHGDNTDVAGVRAALALHAPLAGDGLRGLRVLILGAGGAARAAVLAVQSAGGAATLCNRTAARAAQAAQELRCAALAWEQRAALANFDVLINCTSVGLWPAPDASPMPDDALAPPLVVLDTIYRPRATRLLQAAEARGCVVLSGSEMFIGQAAAQFETWHGGHATTLSTMRAALQE